GVLRASRRRRQPPRVPPGVRRPRATIRPLRPRGPSAQVLKEHSPRPRRGVRRRLPPGARSLVLARPRAMSAVSRRPGRERPSGTSGGPQNTPAAPQAGPASGGGLDADAVRGHWSAILDALQQIRRPSWALISQHAHVNGLNGSTLVLGFRTEGLVSAFRRGT